MKRAWLLVLSGLAGAATLCLALQPIHSTKLRLLLLGAAVLFGATLVALGWRRKAVRAALFGLLALAIGLVLLPGRSPDVGRLRQAYVDALSGYNGVPYVWGGEGRLGIDCSGLPRRAFRDALWREGLHTANGTLIREALRQWWGDASAKALGEGHGGSFAPMFPVTSLKAADVAGLEPGDVAITASGVHCLVHLEGNRWIQADPGEGRVVIDEAATTVNPWFFEPVTLFRWRMLAPEVGPSSRP